MCGWGGAGWGQGRAGQCGPGGGGQCRRREPHGPKETPELKLGWLAGWNEAIEAQREDKLLVGRMELGGGSFLLGHSATTWRRQARSGGSESSQACPVRLSRQAGPGGEAVMG